eukprot:2127160-Lingulodinium_polyedra.AAC.1
MLQLEVNMKYASRWVSTQWRGWKTRFSSLSSMPASSLQEGSNAKRPHDSLKLEQYSASTLGLLALLCQWQKYLSKNPAEHAKQILECLIFAGVPAEFEWSYHESYSEPHPPGIEGCTETILVKNRAVDTGKLISMVSSLRLKEFRLLPQLLSSALSALEGSCVVLDVGIGID